MKSRAVQPDASLTRLRYLAPIVATAIVVLFLLVAALPLMHWFEAEGQDAALQSNQEDWQRLGIENYQFSFVRRCDCGPLAGRHLGATVNGSAVTVTDVADGNRAVFPEQDWPTTVPALFALVAAALESEPYELEVSYDADYGFPRKIRIDPERRVDGDESELVVERFDPRARP